MNKRILLIDDDQKLAELVVKYLTQFAFDVTPLTQPEEALRRLQELAPDLVILDVMLPGMDGFEVCRRIRREKGGVERVPILMLTARGDVTDRIVGLELGADDYLPKPFEPRELLARIQSVLRRTEEKSGASTSEFGSLSIDFRRREATLEGVPLGLSTMEFEALALFAKHNGEVLSRDQILDSLRGIDWEAYNRSVDVLVSRLRQKLKDDLKAPKFLKTVRNYGYLFLGGK